METRPEIRAVIFDLGGVIMRTEDPQPRVALAERLGITRAELETIVFNNRLAMAGERGLATPDEIWAEAARQLGLPAEGVPAFRKEFFRGDRVDFDLVAFIQELRPRYRTAALSNTWNVDLPRYIREEMQITDTFDVVVSSAQAGVRKPDPEIFRLTLEQLNAQPAEAVFVDDFAENITAAAALGLHVVHFTGAEQAKQALRRLLWPL